MLARSESEALLMETPSSRHGWIEQHILSKHEKKKADLDTNSIQKSTRVMFSLSVLITLCVM